MSKEWPGFVHRALERGMKKGAIAGAIIVALMFAWTFYGLYSTGAFR